MKRPDVDTDKVLDEEGCLSENQFVSGVQALLGGSERATRAAIRRGVRTGSPASDGGDPEIGTAAWFRSLALWTRTYRRGLQFHASRLDDLALIRLRELLGVME